MKLLKYIDAFTGSFMVLCARLLLKGRKEVRKHDAFLIIRPGGIGDAILLIPVISALRKRFPQAVIDILAETRNSAVFALCQDVNRILNYDKIPQLLTAIRCSYDVVIDTEQWHRLSAAVARMTRAPILIGFATNQRKKLFTHSVLYSHDDYEVDSFLRLLKPLEGPVFVDLENQFLKVPLDSTDKIRSLLAPIRSKKIVAIFPGSSIEERRWGSDHFRQVAKELVENCFSVAVVGGRDECKAGVEIAAELHETINLCGKLSLVETAAVLKEAALLVSGDSGILHLGFGLGTKTLSLFGPGIEKKWAPRGQNHVVINKNLDCSPCTKFGYTPKCRRNTECMKQITADEVVAEALTLLKG
jgi:ADP-heptose:LPS heptosyltransferase